MARRCVASGESSLSQAASLFDLWSPMGYRISAAPHSGKHTPKHLGFFPALITIWKRKEGSFLPGWHLQAIGHLERGQGELEKGKAHVATLVHQNFWLSSIFWVCQGTFTPRSTPSILCTWEGAIPWHRWGWNTGSALSLHIPPEDGSCRKAGPNTWPQSMLPSREEVMSLQWFCQVNTLNCALPAVKAISFSQAGEGRPALILLSKWLINALFINNF